MIKNWQHLCIFGRLYAADNEIENTRIYHDGKVITLSTRDGRSLDYIDVETGEVLLTQGDDGFPEYTSEWADEIPESPYQIA